ncbi:MAG: 2'-5' RNA ligase family protein [Candidatus Liptonbacteria bacterium]|nr:2'-5' RNA ligase family protein [Candidatus Liptonbacteria bacterium]
MPRLAIDVVLLPDAEMTDAAILANRQLPDERIRLFADGYLPHISLAMCCVESRYIENIKRVLRGIVDDHRSFLMEITGIEMYKFQNKAFGCGLRIAKTRELSLIRQQVVADLRPYAQYNPESSDYYPAGSSIDPGSMKFLKTYENSQDDSGFLPHITLGFGALDESAIKYPKQFQASILALCHMGDFCTCAKVLASFDLSGKD